MEKKITIKDIAREAGVSPSAVSLVLNNQPCRISENTRALIVKTAEKYNYRANAIARSMITKKSNTIGVIIPDIENVFFSSLIKKLETLCHERGYLLLIVNSNNESQKDLDLFNLLSLRQIDGLFYVPSNESFRHEESIRQSLLKLQVPVVLVDRVFPDFPFDRVYSDNRQGAYDVVTHLIQNGHTKIGCITIPVHKSNGKARISGYLDAMRENNLPVEDYFIYTGDYRAQSGYEAAAALYAKTTAVFAGNDMMALGFLKYLIERGISVPNDYSVVGYDDVINPYLLNFELTSVAQDVSSIAAHAFRIMFERLQHADQDIQEIKLLPKLMIRGSVAEPKEG